MFLSLITALLLCSQDLVTAQTTPNISTDVPWPNAFPKQLAVVRRRRGITTAEFLYHHTIVHGRKSRNAPDSIDQPLAYVQDHIFDSVYGINTSTNTPEPSFFGHNDMTELYSRSEDAFSTPPPNNYTASVIGPDGNAFSDFSAAVSTYAYEKFVETNNTCLLSDPELPVYNAFYWVFADASNANESKFDNTTFATPIMKNLLASFLPGTVYNASIHTPVPGLDSRPYYGGYGNPTLNAVFKFWLCDDNHAVTSFRNAQMALIAQNDGLGVDLDNSFVIFTRAVLMYDRSKNIPFDTERATKALFADRVRGDVAGPPQ